VSDDQRWLHLRNAHVLLFPIRSNPINLARCPAKTFAYAQARRPVITCRVGEVPEVLEDAPTYVAPTPEAFADAIESAMKQNLPDVDYGVEKHNWGARAEKLLDALDAIK
jgi:glycosyltransferase involved in cell wall biosynthesis